MNYTIGAILRLGLLKNHKGEPYKSKSAVTTVLEPYKKSFKKSKTPWGEGYVIPQSVIDKLNRRWE